MNLKSLFDVLKEAGNLALEEQKKLIAKYKEDKSIVTNGDILVSNFLETELVKLFPDYQVFSEENSEQKPSSCKVIIIDPIDGTESYYRKQDSWSILIGFLENLTPVGGVVYQPSTKNLYYAFKNKGAFWESTNNTVKLIAKGKGELSAVISPKDYAEKEFLSNLGIENYQQSYSAALKIMEIAKGNVDIYPNFRKKCSWWDLVAPSIILEEAGGKITYEEKINPSFNSLWINSRFCALGSRTLNLSVWKKKGCD